MNGEYRGRLTDRVLVEMLREHAAVLVVGPRATGKTTTCERLAQTSIRLGNERQAAAMQADAAAVLRGRDEPILIDEWQLAPSSLSAIKERVDTNATAGQFIVTGSVRGDLDSPTWPGTGRLVRLDMHGLTEREVDGNIDGQSWIDRVRTGNFESASSPLDLRDYVNRALRSGFPEPTLRLGLEGRQRWLRSYVDQLVTRDAADLGTDRDPQRLRRYLEALALNSAGIVSDVTLYESAGINKITARSYDTLLQNLLVTVNIPAWRSNRPKRLVLAPKRYLCDAGLFTGVLGLTTDDVLGDGDLLGRVLDTFVMSQLRAECALMPLSPQVHHLRSQQGRHEIDIIIEFGTRKVVAIEVKATTRPKLSDAAHLRWLLDDLGDNLSAAVLLHTGSHSTMLGPNIHAMPISSLWS